MLPVAFDGALFDEGGAGGNLDRDDVVGWDYGWVDGDLAQAHGGNHSHKGREYGQSHTG